MVNHPAASAITMALASPSPSMDIAGQLNYKPQPSIMAGAKRLAGLPPTPPNSISPNLPAHAVRAGLASPPPIRIDEDVQVQDAWEHHPSAGPSRSALMPLSKGALSGLETTQAITPSLLARDYLPIIMLGHGPVAIKHVMGCLTHSVPGFSRIPPAKARRLVVAALENRAGGGQAGDIEFEKVGWGRWDAHVRGGQSLSGIDGAFVEAKLSPPVSEPDEYAVSHAGSGYPIKKKQRTQHAADVHGRSWTGSSMPSMDEERLEYMSMSEHEADNMSLDGSETNDSMSDSGDETEPEDWAALGADAIRKSSIPTAASGSVRRNYNLLCIPGTVYNRRFSNSSSVRRTSQTLVAKSVPNQHRAGWSPSLKPINDNNVFNTGLDTRMDLDQTPEERDAIQALLSMGSM